MNYAPDIQQPQHRPAIYLSAPALPTDASRPRGYYITLQAEDISFARSGYRLAPVAAQADKFYSLMKRWRDETGGDSSLSNIVGNINYLKIIRLGDDALPFIFAELKKEPAPWFVALRVITDDDSVGNDSPGDFRKIAQAWLKWGEDHGYKNEITPR